MYIIIPMVEEIFKELTYPGVKTGLYLISNYGSIRNTESGKIFTPNSTNSSGYVHTSLCTETPYKYISVLIERLVAWEFCEGYNKQMNIIEVNHKDANPENNYYENLEWVTPNENKKFAYIHGNREIIIPDSSGPRESIRGVSNPNNKFSDDIIHQICKLLSEGLTTKKILRIYKTTKKDNQPFYTLLMNLKHKKAWHHITEKYKY
jgi:hypothetical protein